MADATTWTAGFGKRNITPEEPIWLSGYAARDKPAQGVKQELYASSAALTGPEGNRVVFVGADVLGFPRSLSEQIAARCREAYDLEAAELLLTASHTHCGPELRTNRAERLPAGQAEIIGAYRETFVDAVVDAVGDSLGDAEPARVAYTHARCGVAMNRRTPRDDEIENHPYPDGPVDHRVPVLRVDDPGEETADHSTLRGLVFGYACHNTTLNFYQFCGDWAGYAKTYLEDEHPDATAVFLTGCAGDQNPYPRREVPYVHHHGRAAANAVETALQADARPLQGPVRTDRRRVTVDYDGIPTREELESRLDADSKYVRANARRLLDQLDQTGELPQTYDLPVGIIRLDPDLVLPALPGEPVVGYAHRLSETIAGTVWTVGYAMENPGYVPTAQVRREGGYEGERWVIHWSHPAPFAASTEDRLVDAIDTMAKRSSTAGEEADE